MVVVMLVATAVSIWKVVSLVVSVAKGLMNKIFTHSRSATGEALSQSNVGCGGDDIGVDNRDGCGGGGGHGSVNSEGSVIGGV